jgi:hypothetical protein
VVFSECSGSRHLTYFCDEQSVCGGKSAIRDLSDEFWGSNGRSSDLMGQFKYCQSLSSCLWRFEGFEDAAIWLYFADLALQAAKQ